MEDFNLLDWQEFADQIGVEVKVILDIGYIRAWERIQSEGILEEMMEVYK